MVCLGKEEAAEPVGMKEIGLYNTTDGFNVSLGVSKTIEGPLWHL